MSQPWLYAGAPEPVGDAAVTLMEGTTFCISDALGNIAGQRSCGVFVRDTRMLSRWVLSATGRRLDPLRVHHHSPHAATFIALVTPVAPGGGEDLLLTRTRLVGDGMREDITVRNTGRSRTRIELRLQGSADFADLFEVKEGRARPREDVRNTSVVEGFDLSLERDGEEYGVTVLAPGASATRDGLGWTVVLEAHESWSTTVQVVVRLRGTTLAGHYLAVTEPEDAVPAQRRRQFRARVPRIATPDRDLVAVLDRSIEDLGTLRIFDPDRPGLPVIAAGAPWFMALFGRDSLLTSLMLLPIDASLALGTLATLSAHQGSSMQPDTEEQPGRILHELRFGPTGTLALGGRNAYYGTADATALFVIAAGELHRWHPTQVTAGLLGHVDRALDWIVDSGVGDGSGFIEYRRATERGLANQGWKDSWDGINFADGTIAQAPIVLAEVQAYTYAAFLARARIADHTNEPKAGEMWRDRAARLRTAFDEAFWLPDRGWYAVGLDRDRRPIDALTSNIGHCLWAGIVPEQRAGEVVGRLMAPDMFTGWGLRTLSSEMGAYNPMSYHNGSVWPHDTALAVAGMARYGFTDEAQRVAVGLLDAATEFGHRLPELFGGFSRDDVPVPVPYPAACSPQAWASAAPVELIRALLGLEPTDDGVLACAPTLPNRFIPLRLRNVACNEASYDIEVGEQDVVVRASTHSTSPSRPA